MINFAVVLLAGGASARMGRDKALLPWAGRTLIEHQLATLRASGATDVFLSVREHDKYGWTGAPIVVDDRESVGPLGGIAAALQHLSAPQLLVLAIDMPMMTAEYLRGLVADTEPGRGIVVERAGVFEPLAAVYPCAAFRIAARQIERGEFAMQEFVRTLISAGLMIARPMSLEEQPLFGNLNSPADAKS